MNYIEHSLIVIATITRRISILDFASLVGIPVGITSSAIGLKICVITAGINSKRKKHDKIISLAKFKRSDEFVLINNVLKEFYDMKEEI